MLTDDEIEDHRIVTVSVSATGGGNKYHLTDECHSLAAHKTRKVPKRVIPNRDLCKRCAHGNQFNGHVTEQDRSMHEALKEIDATDVPNGELADHLREVSE